MQVTPIIITKFHEIVTDIIFYFTYGLLHMFREVI